MLESSLLIIALSVLVGAWCISRAASRLTSEIERWINATEKTRPVPEPTRQFTTPIDAPVQSVTLPREKGVPLLTPQDVAPNLRRPPRPPGGFGHKISS